MLYNAASASSFIGSLGVNIHLSYTSTPYGNLSQVQSELNYLGLPNVRDNFSNSTYEYNALSTLAGLGYKIDMLGNTNLSTFLTNVRNLETAHPGSVLAVVNVAVPMAPLCVNCSLNGALTVPVVFTGFVTVMVWQPMTSV